MKTKDFLMAVACTGMLTMLPSCSGDEYDDSLLTGRVDNLESRVSKLEELCKQMNTNISSLQTLVQALQQNDYITAVLPVTQGSETIGYTLSFKNNNPITIYHGKDGADGTDGKNGTNGADGSNGTNGKDGKDGTTPVIGVKLHTDGCYYWTINGEWLLSDTNEMIKAQGTDGTSGANGANGSDGADGITPQLKIEDGYWYVSYNNAQSWLQLDKAVAESQDAIFQEVTVGDSNVTFTLSSGETFQIPLYDASTYVLEVKEAGTLKDLLTAKQKHDITSLKVKGTINQTDISSLKYQFSCLAKLDLSNTIYASQKFNWLLDGSMNTTLEELSLPIFEVETEVSIKTVEYPYLEKLVISSDSINLNVTSGVVSTMSITAVIDSLIVAEGVTMTNINNDGAVPYNIFHLILPSTLKRLHKNTLNVGTLEQIPLTFVCKSVIPPAIGIWSASSFSESTSDSSYKSGLSIRTLKVPSQSIELYSQAAYWRHFGTIIPIEE